MKDSHLCTISLVFLERELWSQPYMFCWIASQLDHARKYLFGVFFVGKTLKENLVIYEELFSQRTFGISKLFRIKIILMFV